MLRLFLIVSLLLALQTLSSCASSQPRGALCVRGDGCILDERERRGPRGSDQLEVTPFRTSQPNLSLDLNIDGYFDHVGELLLPGQISGATCGGGTATQMFDVSSLDARPGTETPGFLTVAEMTENYSTTESGAVSTRANVGPVLANLLSSRGISQETAAGVGAAFASGQTSIVAARGKYIEVRLSDGVIRQLRDRTVMDGDATQRAHLYNCILELALSRHDHRLLTGLSGFYMESLEINSNFNRDFELAVEAAVSNPDEEVAVLELRGEVASSLNGEFRSLVTSEFRQFSQETFRYGAIAYTSPYTFFVFAGQGNVRIPALGGRRRVEICNGGEHRQTGTSNNYLQVVIADQPGRVPAVDVAGVDLPLQTHGHRHMRCRTYRLESPLDIAFYDMDPSNQAEVASIEGTVAFFR